MTTTDDYYYDLIYNLNINFQQKITAILNRKWNDNFSEEILLRCFIQENKGLFKSFFIFCLFQSSEELIQVVILIGEEFLFLGSLLFSNIFAFFKSFLHGLDFIFEFCSLEIINN